MKVFVRGTGLSVSLPKGHGHTKFAAVPCARPDVSLGVENLKQERERALTFESDKPVRETVSELLRRLQFIPLLCEYVRRRSAGHKRCVRTTNEWNKHIARCATRFLVMAERMHL